MVEKRSKIKAFLEISRAKLLLGSIGLPLAGLLLGASDNINEFMDLKSLLYILLHYSIIVPACHLNCLCDYNVDRKYKRYMSESVDILGKRLIKVFIVGEFSIAILIILYFVTLGRIATSVCGVLGIISAITYSAEPFRIKKRGFLSPFPVMIGMYTLSPLGGWFVLRDGIDLPFIVFITGYALMNEGFTLVNTCEDYSEDKAEGIKTWAHVFGLKRTLQIAAIFSFCGLLSIIYLGYRIYLSFDGLKDIPDTILLILSAILVLKAAFEVNDVGKGKDLEQRAKLYGKKLAKWFISTRYPVVLTALFILL
ncbi:MAG: prenyltransferase [Thermoplasmata archaeon]|nr:prenyltransferase [Thermoplasmata archaeon]